MSCGVEQKIQITQPLPLPLQLPVGWFLGIHTEAPAPHLPVALEIAQGSTSPVKLPGPGGVPRPGKSLPGWEAVLGFCGMVGRAARVGLGDWRRGFGLVGVQEELRDLELASTLDSALAFFSGVPKPKRFSGRPGCSLGTETKSGRESKLENQNSKMQ